jgi:hypothetical protein
MTLRECNVEIQCRQPALEELVLVSRVLGLDSGALLKIHATPGILLRMVALSAGYGDGFRVEETGTVRLVMKDNPRSRTSSPSLGRYVIAEVQAEAIFVKQRHRYIRLAFKEVFYLER